MPSARDYGFLALPFEAGKRSVRVRDFAHVHPRHKREHALRSAQQRAGYDAVAKMHAQLDAEAAAHREVQTKFPA